MNIYTKHNRKFRLRLLIKFIVLIIVYLYGDMTFASDGKIVLNNQMPDRSVSVIATQSVVLKPGFHASAAQADFNAKIGSINSVYPQIVLAEGSGNVQQPLESEKPTSVGGSVKIIVPIEAINNDAIINKKNSLTGIEFFDGLGRTNMTLLKDITSGMDLSTITNYDDCGRLCNEWLATPVNSTEKPEAGIIMQEAKNFYNDNCPYYSNDWSELKTLKTYKPGENFRINSKAGKQGLPESFVTDVRRYIVNSSDIILLSEDYPLLNMDIHKTEDEDGNTSYTFTDFMGNVVLQRRLSDGENFDTYYLYNDIGQLCYVLSPEASDEMSTVKAYSRSEIDNQHSPLSQYAYAYKYDIEGQCIAKKIPGRGWEKYIYDQSGRIVFMQDENQKVNNKWIFYKYDALGRPIQSGETTISDPDEMRLFYSTTNAVEVYQAGNGYSNTKPLGEETKLLNVNYYDSYDFINLTEYNTNSTNLGYSGQTESRYSKIVDGTDIALKGLLTGSVVNMINDRTSEVTAIYYNDKGQVIQKKSNNHLGGFSNDTYTYSFTGQLMTNTHTHTSAVANVTELYNYKYNRWGNLTSIRHKLNNCSEIVMDSVLYDQAGRSIAKILHGGMQTVNYSYNIQGQLKSISSPVFTEELFYDDNTNGNPLYNGSIASITYNGNSSYRFSYDGLNRLKESVYGEQNNEGNNGLFSEYIDSYDKNGNILGLTRSGMSRDLFNMENGVAPLVKNNIDQLIMGYNGNQIKSVKDNNNTEQYLSVGMGDFADKQNTENPDDDEYKYDYNGNCIADLNKGIAWTSYNYLDRPQTVQMINGNKISYGYDASGTKKWTEYYWAEEPLQIPLGNTEMVLSPENVDRYSRTDYCGRYIYIDGALSRILVPEGYVQVTGLDATNWSYAYSLTDHLGNSRAQLLSAPLSEATSTSYSVVSTTDYYPTGMEIRRSDSNSSGNNPYLYAGKELERMHGLNLYEFPYRWYDYAVPGFTTPDPFAEKQYAESPYVYCGGDPVNRVDPTGLEWYRVSNNSNQIAFIEGWSVPTLKIDGTTYSHIGKEVLISTDKETLFGDEYGNIVRTLAPQGTTTVEELRLFDAAAAEDRANYTATYEFSKEYNTMKRVNNPILTITKHEFEGYKFEPMLKQLETPTASLIVEQIKVNLLQIPYAQKAVYTDNPVLNTVTFVNNACASVINGGVSLANSALYIVQTPPSENVSQLKNDFANTVQGVNQFFNASLSQHGEGIRQALTSVSFWEDFAGTAGTMWAGGVLTKTTGSVRVATASNAAKGVTRSLDDLSTIRGASWKEAESLIPEGWIRGPLNKGEGIKFVNPAKKGEQILLEKGWLGAKDPLHAGPYMKISRNGTVERIPLQGNPTLK